MVRALARRMSRIQEEYASSRASIRSRWPSKSLRPMSGSRFSRLGLQLGMWTARSSSIGAAISRANPMRSSALSGSSAPRDVSVPVNKRISIRPRS